ncbi:MAG: redoxin domain-containing protein [Rhodospirillaceae bacterium]|nr:redoxin domain-containing protein [Rhodospirillaceae bacterium]
MTKTVTRRLCALFVLACLWSAAPSITAVAAPGAGDPVDLIGARVIDTEGRHHRIGIHMGKVRPAVLVFLDTACPVATRYVPTLNELHAEARAQGVALYGILSNPAITWQASADFVDDFGVTFPVVLDSTGDLALRLGPRVTSESFVISTNDRVVYRGRIDDRFAAVGKLRTRIGSHDLRTVIQAMAGGSRPEPYATEAVGCFHHDWSRAGASVMGLDEITYNRHIAPLLEANCVECHRDGGIAPFSLEGYDNAKRWHRMVSFMTGERLMPPWRAVQGFGAFRDARRLSDHQIALLASWSENGAPLGAAVDTMPAPARSSSKWRLGEPDLVLRMAEPFRVPADGDDIYRYFVIPAGFAEDKVVTALEFSPGDAKVVHHANYLMDYSGAARAEDAKDDEPGFSVFGTGGFLDYNAWGIGGWTPGADPYVLDKGLGMWLPKGGDLVLEVHYHLNGKATADRSEVGFHFAREPVSRYLDGVVIGTQDLRIPPGEENYWRHFWMEVPSGMALTDVTPHMHFLGREFIAIATLPDGSERPLIRIADWDFRWQNTFAYREPVHLPAGSRIDAWVRYDNAADNPQNPALEPETVTWGWETTDEMSELWIGFVPDTPADRQLIVSASERSWYRPAHVSDDEIDRLLARLPAFE